jgi:antitoxin component YwqK of YwqJK toxin-antitoxin module
MAADFMARPVQLRNKLLWLIVGGLLGCDTGYRYNYAAYSPPVLLNSSEQQAMLQNGLLIIDHQPFSGTLFTLFPGTSDTAEICRYLEGKEHGEWKKNYPSNKIREKRYYNQGQKTGEYIVWWENGRKQLQYFFEADEYEGACKEWSETGFLNKLMHYKRGHEEGHQQWWYDNGKIKANYIIKDGRRFGLLGTKNCLNVSDSIFKK